MNHPATVSAQVDYLHDQKPHDPEALAPWIYERWRHHPQGVKKFERRLADLRKARSDLFVSLHIASVASRLTEILLRRV
jgi:hypothetical protein